MFNKNKFIDNVRNYYDKTTEIYITDLGTTLQAGFLEIEGANNQTITSSNLAFAYAAGIKEDDYILDAGCGVCGPAVDIVQNIANTKIEAITISPVQAQKASALITATQLNQQISIYNSDFHTLPFSNKVFDMVIFFESSGYSYNQETLFGEVYRVLKPGGGIYIKDVFKKEGPLTTIEKDDLKTFNQLYAMNTSTISYTVACLQKTGFQQITWRNLSKSGLISGQRWREATGWLEDTAMTKLGEVHFTQFQNLPTFFGGVKAMRID